MRAKSEEKRTERQTTRQPSRGHPPVIQNAYSPLPDAASPSSVISSRSAWYSVPSHTPPSQLPSLPLFPSLCVPVIPHHSPAPSLFLPVCLRVCPSLFAGVQSIRHSWRDGYGWRGREHGGQRPAPWISFDRLHIILVAPPMRDAPIRRGVIHRDRRHHEGGRPMRSHASTAVNFPLYPFLIERQRKEREGVTGGAKDARNHCYKSQIMVKNLISR